MDVSSVPKPVQQAAPKRPVQNQQNPQPRESKPHPSEGHKVAQAQTQTKPVVNAQGQVTGRHLNVTA